MLLSSALITFETVRVPPLEVNEGVLLILDWPRPQGGTAERRFFDALTKRTSVPGFTVFEKAVIWDPFANPFMASSFGDITRGLDARVLERLLGRHKIQQDTAMRELPLFDRSFAALAGALLIAKFVIFSTSGLDPNTSDKLMGFAKDSAQEGKSLLCMQYPLHERHLRRVVFGNQARVRYVDGNVLGQPLT